MQTYNDMSRVDSREIIDTLEDISPWLVRNNNLLVLFENAKNKEFIHLLIKIIALIQVIVGVVNVWIVYVSNSEPSLWRYVLGFLFVASAFSLLSFSGRYRVVWVTDEERRSIFLIQGYKGLHLGILNSSHQENHFEAEHLTHLVHLAREVKDCERLVKEAEAVVGLTKGNHLDSFVANADLGENKKRLEDAKRHLDQRFRLFSDLGLVNKDKGKIFQLA